LKTRRAPDEHISMIKFKLQVRPADIPKLAKQYGPEQDDDALAAGGRIRSGDYERSNIETIFKWKTRGRGISRLRRNSSDEIADALRLAANAKTERAAIAVLIGLQGVNVPVASAILTAIDPERYTVIDFRALEALGSKSTDRSVNFYLVYLDTCRQLATAHHVSLRDLDRALWQWSSQREARREQRPRSLV
jgi:predicted KAP-like P-loop ATPase